LEDIPISDKIPELDIAIKAAKKAGEAILEIYHEDYKKFTKNDDSPIKSIIKRNDLDRRST
jgi:3'-phosphoadenosine 5'-phosphosulfate (PAPS) 3'-phosphatase